MPFLPYSPPTIFQDKNVKDIRELDDVSVLMESSMEENLKCKHALSLHSNYPRDTFHEWAFVAYPGSGSKWVHEVKKNQTLNAISHLIL